MAKLTKSQKLISIAVGLSLSSLVAAALYGGGPAESWTESQIAQLVTSVNSDIASFTASFGIQLTSTFEQVITAVAVATKQEALSASQVSNSTVQATNQLLNATTAQNTNEQVVQAYLDYNGSTGQGYQPCSVLDKNKSLDHAWDGISSVVNSKVSTSEVGNGRLVTSSSSSMQARLQQHKDKFCTTDEANAGLCNVSTLPGADTNAAMLFEPSASDSLVDQAKSAYIANILGTPDQMIVDKAGKSEAGQAYMLNKARKDAFMSIPSYSLNMIAQANTQSPDFDNRSPNEMLQLRVNQYFGGKEAEDWAATLTRQQPRGLLVEAAKMEGLSTWINQKQYEQNQRIIANLAAQQLAMAEPLKQNLDIEAARMKNSSATSQVK
jgi:hypothetical protein